MEHYFTNYLYSNTTCLTMEGLYRVVSPLHTSSINNSFTLCFKHFYIIFYFYYFQKYCILLLLSIYSLNFDPLCIRSFWTAKSIGNQFISIRRKRCTFFAAENVFLRNIMRIIAVAIEEPKSHLFSFLFFKCANFEADFD